MSDAGPRRQSRGISGGLEVSLSAPAKGDTERTCRWKALRAWEATALVCCCGKGPRLSTTSSSKQRAHGVGRDRKRPWPHRSACAREDNTRARVDAFTQKRRRPLAATRRGEDESAGAVRHTAGEGHGWRTRHQIAAPLGVGDAFTGYPAPASRVPSDLSTSVLGEGGVPRGRSAR